MNWIRHQFQFLVILIGFIAITYQQATDNTTSIAPTLVDVTFPKVTLYGFKAEIQATLSWKLISNSTKLSYELFENDGAEPIKTGELIANSEQSLKVPSSTVSQGDFLNAYAIGDVDMTSQVYRYYRLVLKLDGKEVGSSKGRVIGMPGWVTILPIIVMVLISLLSSQATVALLLGIFISASFINGFNPLTGFLRTFDTYTINALADRDHCKVIMFTFYLSAAVTLIQKSGGAEAMANAVTKLATNRWRGQWAAFIVGLLIFIDDLSSCMVVGANMTTVTDQLYLSHEKLAFIVHVTSAQVTSLSPISSWIGFILGVIQTQFKILGVKEEPFIFFLKTIPSRFFPIFAIALCAILIALKRDFGIMLDAERRGHFLRRVVDDTTDIEGVEDPMASLPNAPKRVVNAALPIVTIVALTIIGIMLTGYYSLLAQIDAGAENVVIDSASIAGAGDSYGALLYASFFTVLMCVIMYRVQNIMTFHQSIEIIMYGCKDMMETMFILVFAWGIGACFEDMGVPTFIVSALSGSLDSRLIPFICCFLAAIMSFTTGTSWGTMTIMFPLALPLAHSAGNEELMTYTASAVLSGAMLGDLISPIAATTILTCTAVKIQVKDHVNSQMPYAALALFATCFFGYLPVGYKAYPDWAGLILGIVFMIIFVFLFGTKTESRDPSKWQLIQSKLFNKPIPEFEEYLEKCSTTSLEKSENKQLSPDEFA